MDVWEVGAIELKEVGIEDVESVESSVGEGIWEADGVLGPVVPAWGEPGWLVLTTAGRPV